jgi:hypothetical protein
MKSFTDNFTQKKSERRNQKSSGWLNLAFKIFLFIAVVMLMKNLSKPKQDSAQGFLLEQLSPQDRIEREATEYIPDNEREQ